MNKRPVPHDDDHKLCLSNRQSGVPLFYRNISFYFKYMIQSIAPHQVLICLFKQQQNCALHIHVKHSKIILRNTILEWEPICSIYLRLSSRHCRSLPLCHQPRQQLATSRCLTHRTCVAVRPDCHVIEKVQGNSHCLGPLQTYVNGVYIYQEKN